MQEDDLVLGLWRAPGTDCQVLFLGLMQERIQEGAQRESRFNQGDTHR